MFLLVWHVEEYSASIVDVTTDCSFLLAQIAAPLSNSIVCPCALSKPYLSNVFRCFVDRRIGWAVEGEKNNVEVERFMEAGLVLACELLDIDSSAC